MKKIIAVAGALALAACGGNAEEPVEAEAEVEETAVAASPAGTYTSTTEDGAEVAVSLNDDGTYSVTENGEEVDAGTWEDGEEGTCLTAEGEAPSCFDIAPGAEEGMFDVTGPDGEARSYSFES